MRIIKPTIVIPSSACQAWSTQHLTTQSCDIFIFQFVRHFVPSFNCACVVLRYLHWSCNIANDTRHHHLHFVVLGTCQKLHPYPSPSSAVIQTNLRHCVLFQVALHNSELVLVFLLLFSSLSRRSVTVDCLNCYVHRKYYASKINTHLTEINRDFSLLATPSEVFLRLLASLTPKGRTQNAFHFKSGGHRSHSI